MASTSTSVASLRNLSIKTGFDPETFTASSMYFLRSECDVSYKDRGGKYQGQTGVTLPKT